MALNNLNISFTSLSEQMILPHTFTCEHLLLLSLDGVSKSLSIRASSLDPTPAHADLRVLTYESIRVTTLQHTFETPHPANTPPTTTMNFQSPQTATSIVSSTASSTLNPSQLSSASCSPLESPSTKKSSTTNLSGSTSPAKSRIPPHSRASSTVLATRSSSSATNSCKPPGVHARALETECEADIPSSTPKEATLRTCGRGCECCVCFFEDSFVCQFPHHPIPYVSPVIFSISIPSFFKHIN
jgi:hypothetical protein